MRESFRAVVTATAATGVGVTAFGERPLSVITVAGMGAIFALGWPGRLGLPARRGTTVLLLLTVAVGVALQVATRDLAYAALWFGLVVVASFVLQLLRRDGRPRLVESEIGRASCRGGVEVGDGAGSV